LDGKSERKGPLGSPRRRWENNIRVDLRKYFGRVWTVFISLKRGAVGGLETS